MSTATKESTEDTELPEVTEAEADMQDMEGGQMRWSELAAKWVQM